MSAKTLERELVTLRARVQREDEAHTQAEEVAADIVLELQAEFYAEDGVRGYFRGIKPRLALHTPAVAISWTTYELFKRLLTDRGMFGDDH